MRVIVESDEGPEQPARAKADVEGAFDAGEPSSELGAAAASVAAASAIDAGPPPQSLIEALGERPSAPAPEDEIDGGPAPEPE